MVDIFISYSRIDRQFVHQLSGHLGRIYESVWYDRSLHGGQDWWREILKRIATSEVLIYLLSPESLRSQYCRAEYQEALRLNKCVIPVLIRPDMTLTADIADLHVIDMSTGITVDNLLDLQTAIRFHLAHSATTVINPNLADTRPTPIPAASRPLLPARHVAVIVGVIGLLIGLGVGALLGTLVQPAPAAADDGTVLQVGPGGTPAQTSSVNTLTLRYNAGSFLLINNGRAPLAVDDLRFVRQRDDIIEASFSAADWGAIALPVGACLHLWTTEYRYLPAPDGCRSRQGWRQVIPARWFWRADNPARTFVVQRDGQTVADCPVSHSANSAWLECAVALRPNG